MTKHVGCVVVTRGVVALWVLWCAVAFAAPQLLNPPAELTAPPDREQLVALVKQRYPRLIEQRARGTPVVIVLFGVDGHIAGTASEIRSVPGVAVTADAEQFERFGALAAHLRYVGLARVELSGYAVLVVYGGLDSRDPDRRLIERLFPQVLAQGASRAVAIWIVFDHEGRVLSTGEEPVEAQTVRAVLESRFPGIQISDMTVRPVMGRDGRPITSRSGHTLQLHCVWLVAGATLPKADE